MKLWRLLATLIDPARALPAASRPANPAVEAAPLHVMRLEERRVLTGGLLAQTFTGLGISAGDGGEDARPITPLSVPPAVVTPSDQTTVEGSPLLFSAGNGRLIRVDDPDIGSSPLVVQITAFEALGRVAPNITVASTLGLTSISGNGSNVLQLQGTLSAVNTALSQLTFYSADNGDFSITITADDPATGESGSGSFQVAASNANPQLQLTDTLNHLEGEQIRANVQLFDPGAFDQPHFDWTVSYLGRPIAEGADRPVEFFALADGNYDVRVRAIDKDGGVTMVQQEVSVHNVPPSAALSVSVRDDEFFLTITLQDQGNDRLDVEVYWSNATIEPDRINTLPGIITISHRYTPEELDADTEDLRITVHVSDGVGSSRSSLELGDNAPIQTERPHIEPLARTPAAERESPPRLLASSNLAEISTPDVFGGTLAGKQDVAAVHQFVIRLVGPDGEESGNYALPENAMENLPAFLSALGVPDGHYRVYLMSGDLERLVLDGYLRGGRIVDPSEESQPAAGHALSKAKPQSHPARDTASISVAGELQTVCNAETRIPNAVVAGQSPGKSSLPEDALARVDVAVVCVGQSDEAAPDNVADGSSALAQVFSESSISKLAFIGASVAGLTAHNLRLTRGARRARKLSALLAQR